MADSDPALAHVLDALLPRGVADGEWGRLVRDARGRRRRLAVAVVTVALLGLVPLTAIAADNGWWFFGTPLAAPAPLGDVVTVESGHSNGVPWAMTAYQTTNQEVCVSIVPNPPTGQPTAGSATMLGCSAVRGSPGAQNAAATAVGLVSTAFKGADGTVDEIVGGPAAADVARVVVVTGSGPETTADTIPAPAQLGLPIRFFLAELPSESEVQSVRALDASGNVLQTVTIP